MHSGKVDTRVKTLQDNATLLTLIYLSHQYDYIFSLHPQSWSEQGGNNMLWRERQFGSHSQQYHTGRSCGGGEEHGGGGLVCSNGASTLLYSESPSDGADSSILYYGVEQT